MSTITDYRPLISYSDFQIDKRSNKQGKRLNSEFIL